MVKCKVCGFRLSEEAKKCPICGTMKGSTKAGSMGAENANLPRYLCPSCKADIIGEHRFCPSCGKELSEVGNMQEYNSSNCIKCGAYLPLNAKFCSECGAKQGINCHSCGATLSLNAKFCYECGAKQNQTQETPMEAFEYEKRGNEYVLKKLKDTSFIDVVIPKVFSEIGENAFRKCSNLETIIIPNSVTKIGKGTFSWCSSLTSVIIPDSVTEIGDEAFAICGLKNVSIENPNFKKSDIRYVFGYSPSLKKIKIGNNIVKVSELD